MYKRLLGLALVGGSMLAANSAQASFTFNTFPYAVGGGVWNVQVNQQTNVPAAQSYRTFKVTNATKSFRVGDLAPVTDADQITIQFFDGPKHPINPDCTGNIVSVTVVGTAGTVATKTGGTGGAWSTLDGIRARFRNNTDPLVKETTELNKNGKNAFKQDSGGEMRVDKNLVKCFTVQVTNFGGQFQDSDEAFTSYDHQAFDIQPDAAPEASSIALMLPALLPLGIVLRRRNRR
jgi:hypothetical protein